MASILELLSLLTGAFPNSAKVERACAQPGRERSSVSDCQNTL
jgi:hypothetical protein